MWKCCFSQSQFWILQQSGKTHPQLFPVITKQIIAECQGNFQIITGIAEIDIGSHSCPSFFPADGSTFHSPVETQSIAPFSQLGPIIPSFGFLEIQFHHQSPELGINKERPNPSGMLLSPTYLLSFTRGFPLNGAPFLLSMIGSDNGNELQHADYFCHILPPQGVQF